MTSWIGPLAVATAAHGAAMASGGLFFLLSAPIMVLDGEEIPVIVLGMTLGLVWIAVGAFQVVCGIGLGRRRLRVPALVSLVAGFVAALPLCGCVPTLALTAVGLVALTRPDVVAAFQRPA